MKFKFFVPFFFVCLLFNILTSQVFSQNQEVVLKEQSGWTIDTITPGLIYYTYKNYYNPHRASQIVHVLEVDYTSPQYSLDIKYVSPSDSLSSVARNAGAIVGINGSYELDATFVKTNGKIHSQVSLPSNHLRYWKHEGAIFYNNTTKHVAIEYGTNNGYFSNTTPNILSGAPMLIDNFVPVGEDFIGDVTGINLNSLDYEDYRRHQGTRHPRTAVALTEGNKLLLIVVDGRRTVSAGMTAKEFTEFLVRYFNPKSALNLDGGGSSTMYIKGSNQSLTDVVNYPTDNNKFDNYGQRSVRTFILVKQEISEEPDFAGGNGTAADPYIIANATHLNNIRKTDWNAAINNKPYFKLANDIDLAGTNWLPINNSEPYAQLHFDGNGHVIKNMSVKGVPYASLFGVLCGSCKNLGVINADVESSNGGGIIAGYVGVKTPSSSAYTGVIENCYTTGIVSGTDGVGGITGNIGKPDAAAETASIVRNCYSTATVIARNTSGNSRAGGLVGILWDKGVLEKSYATGTVKSSLYGAGGLIGWSDASIFGLVALNDSIINTTQGNIGRIAAFMGSVGGVQAQGINCWGSDGVVLNNAGTYLNQGDLNEGEITERNNPYDGVSKSAEYLGNPMHYYMDLAWDFASDNNIWSQTMSNGKPIFQWLINRSDYAMIDGHGGITSVDLISNTTKVVFRVYNKQILINADSNINNISVYNVMGNEIMRISQPGLNHTLKIHYPGIYIVRASVNSHTVNHKVLIH